MFKKCKYCNSAHKEEGYFCSDECEIKNHASELMAFRNNPVSAETKEEISEIPILDTKIIEKREESIQVEADLKIKSKVLETPTLS